MLVGIVVLERGGELFANTLGLREGIWEREGEGWWQEEFFWVWFCCC